MHTSAESRQLNARVRTCVVSRDTKECAREKMASAAVAVPVRVVSSRNASRRGCAENPGGWIS
jgi:hypothetical protein